MPRPRASWRSLPHQQGDWEIAEQLGRGRIRIRDRAPLHQIVGLMRDSKYGDLREDNEPIGFFPVAQETESFGPFFAVIVRTELPRLLGLE